MAVLKLLIVVVLYSANQKVDSLKNEGDNTDFEENDQIEVLMADTRDGAQGTETAQLRQDNAALANRLTDMEETVKALSDRLDTISNVTYGLEDSANQKLDFLHKEVDRNDIVLHGILRALKGHIAPMESQYAVLTKEIRDIDKTVNETTTALSNRLDSVSKFNHNIKDSANQKVDIIKKKMDKDIHVLYSWIKNLLGVINRKVAFNAVVAKDRAVKLLNGQKIAPTEVTVNTGRAYNAQTGIFTAPFTGLYFFMALSSPKDNRYIVSLVMKVEGKSVAYGYAYRGDQMYQYQTATVHTVQYLKKGQQVWLESNYESYIRDNYRTIFSGFLIHAW